MFQKPQNCGKRMIRPINLIILFFAVFVVSGCATYQNKMKEPLALIKAGQAVAAAELLKKNHKPGDRDELLQLLEYATALQMSGDYKASNQAFLRADKLADQIDYHSATKVAAATLGSEEMIQYKGESFEKLMINAMMAMNFLMLGDQENALVSARRLNEKITKIRNEGRKDYEDNPFAFYLSALAWEADKNYDNAYISFEKAYEAQASIPALPEDLIRSAKLARRDETWAKWRKQFPHIQESPDWYNRNLGELVIIVQQGWGPQKRPRTDNHRLPTLVSQYSRTQGARATLISAQSGPALSKSSELVYDLDAAAKKTLAADYAWLVARKLGAFVAKEVVADQIRQRDDGLGLLALIFMHASDRADLRQWVTLPQTFQTIRIRTRPGSYKLKIEGLDASGGFSGESLSDIPISIQAGKKTFYIWRSIK